MTKEKITLIDKICTLHPSLGVDKRWSEYTGGMKDSGKWYFRKMLDVPIEELQEFYDAQVLQKELDKAARAKDMAEFESSGMTNAEWVHKQMSNFMMELNVKMTSAFK